MRRTPAVDAGLPAGEALGGLGQQLAVSAQIVAPRARGRVAEQPARLLDRDPGIRLAAHLDGVPEVLRDQLAERAVRGVVG